MSELSEISISGTKFSEIYEVPEEEEKSTSKRIKEYKPYVVESKPKKQKPKKLKNIINRRETKEISKLTELEIDSKMMDCLSLFIKKESDKSLILQLIKQVKTQLSLERNENLLLLCYEVYNFISNLDRNVVNLKIKVNEDKVSLKIKKKKYLDKKELKLLREYIEKDTFFFDTKGFEEYKYIEKEIDSYIEKPTDISSGVIVCSHCGSDKTFSWQKQVRRSDEPMTTFFHCMKCNKGGKLSS